MSGMTAQEAQDLRLRILAAAEGRGEMPSPEELRDALSRLRQDRATASADHKESKVKGDALPGNLNDLFK